MCGIFGAVRLSGTFDNADRKKFQQLTDLVRYRGPDDGGSQTWSVGTGAVGTEKFDAFLGSRRLSIIDLSALGHMPMTNGRGRWIVYNGEIFNYLELRRSLEQEYGYRFRSGTDTEVILAVYEQYGEKGFELFNGMWAFAILDLPKRKLILSRDRFSIKPLHILHCGDQVYFASEIKQLIPLLSKRVLNTPVMMAFLSQALLDHSEETFFEGIRRVKASTWLSICLQSGKIAEQVYWKIPEPSAASTGDVMDEFRSILIDSVRLRLRSDVKVGVLLSGGLDSSAIAVLAKGFANLETYSVIADDPRYDERRYIELIAAKDIKNTKIVFKHGQILEDMHRVLHHSDEPVAGFSAFAQFRLFEAIKRNGDATVLLSGQGGDEILLGYLKFFYFHLKNLINAGQLIRAGQQLASAVLQRTITRQFTVGDARRYSPFLRRRAPKIFRTKNSNIAIWECADLRSRQMLDIAQFSVPALTHYEDRNSAAHSLEVRHPFLDHRLVALAVNLPTELKLHHGWTKYILRKSITELPDEVRWRRDKQGFLVPEELWLRGELRRVVEGYFRRSRLSELGILDDGLFLEQYKAFCARRAVSSSEIARVFIAEMWARQFLS